MNSFWSNVTISLVVMIVGTVITYFINTVREDRRKKEAVISANREIIDMIIPSSKKSFLSYAELNCVIKSISKKKICRGKISLFST